MAELADEVEGGTKDLAELLGERVISFAYPYGYYDETVHGWVRRVFSLAVTVDEGLNGVETDLCLIRRALARPGETQLELAGRVRFGHNPRFPLRRDIARAKWRIYERAGG